MSDVLFEEFEVLESIYSSELLSRISETEIRINVEPDDPPDGEDTIRLDLRVSYPSGYPDQLPELSAEPIEGDIENEEIDQLLNDLRTLGADNLGMAMTFTLVSHLREQLSVFVRSRAERRRQEESEKERLLIEAEETKTRGTAVTRDSFLAWKGKFDKEMALKKVKDQEDKVRGLTPREREEFKKLQTRLTGLQLFERNKDWDTSEDLLVEEEGTSVDISQYERGRQDEEEDEDDHVPFSDSE